MFGVLTLLTFPAIANEQCTLPGTTPEDALYASPTVGDSIGCVSTQIFVNGTGPYRFVLDTASNETLLSPRLAAALGLDLADAKMALVHGINGSEMAPVVTLPSMTIGRIEETNLGVVVVDNKVHPEAEGLLGGKYLEGRRIEINFRFNRVSIKTGGGGARPGYIALNATMRFGTLPLVRATVSHVPVYAIIDTGAERSVGNAALLAALQDRGEPMEAQATEWLAGVVGPPLQTTVLKVPEVEVGRIYIRHLPLHFGVAAIFDTWQLNDEPAIVLGMDVLGRFDALVIDYTDSQVLFRYAM
jgi:hypothetical protein